MMLAPLHRQQIPTVDILVAQETQYLHAHHHLAHLFPVTFTSNKHMSRNQNQIGCVQNSSALIAIDSQNYAILKFHYGIYNNFINVREENCQFLDDRFSIGSVHGLFNITSNVNWTLTVYNCKRVLAHELYNTGKEHLR